MKKRFSIAVSGVFHSEKANGAAQGGHLQRGEAIGGEQMYENARCSPSNAGKSHSGIKGKENAEQHI